jgi:hypothetical protein
MSLIIPANSAAATGFDVANSCRFNSTSSDKLTRTFGSGGSVVKWTYSTWFKISYIGGNEQVFFSSFDNGDNYSYIKINGNNKLEFRAEASGSDVLRYTLTRRFRDPSAFMHLVVALDSSLGTAGDRIKIWINGVRETVFDASTAPSQDATTLINSAAAHEIGHAGDGSDFFNGYMSQVGFINNAQYDADQFGEFDEDSGIWKPIDISGLTFGQTSFFLDFADSADLGDDESGNSNDWTEVNLTAIDQSTDTCTNNFATFNPLTTIDASLIKEGNLFPELATADESVVSTIAMTSGKWYWEAKVTDQGSRGYHGITSYTVPQIGGNAPRISGFSFAVAFGHDGTTGAGVGTVNSNFKGSAIANDEILTFCFDADNGQIWIDINAVDISGTATVTGLTTGIPYFAFFEESGSNTDRTDVKYNFGSPIVALSSANADGEGFGSFEYAPPSGYFALCTKNLAEYG